MRHVWLRAAALALIAVGGIAGLTAYFSTEEVPPCLVSGVRTWQPPTDRQTHRYEVVFLEHAACFFAMDEQHRLVGVLRPSETDGTIFRRLATTLVLSDTLTVPDREHRVIYVTQPGLLGFRVLDLRTRARLSVVGFKGFTWNPRFGPNPPSHGLSLAPDRPELWVLDAPNGTVHVFDVSAVPAEPPKPLADIRLSKPISGDESPCSNACPRIGSLQHSADGRFVYVGDSGAVIDTSKREEIANLEALHNSRVHAEVDYVDGKPVVPMRR